jgi:hypothetical protein
MSPVGNKKNNIYGIVLHISVVVNSLTKLFSTMKKLLLTIVVFGSTLFAIGQKEKVQTSYIYNFTNYINWPDASKDGDFVIGILGSGPITTELTNLANVKKIVSQSIQIKTYATAGEIGKCQVLFVVENKSSQLKEVLSRIGSNPTLVITESPGLAANGAGINFVVRDGKIIFELNKGAIEKNGLQVNSKLIGLAIMVN